MSLVFGAGLAGSVFSKRPTALVFYEAILGLPVVMRIDEQKQSFD